MYELLPYSCRYENSRGEVLRLDEAPIVAQSGGLFDYQWQMNTADRAAGDGGSAVIARRPVQEKSVTVDVFADTQEEHNAAMNRLHDVLDYDVGQLTPGKLWVNDQYIRCFAYASVKSMDRDWSSYTAVRLTLKVVSPAWVAEESVVVHPSGSVQSGAAEKKYMGKYPYKYAEDGAAYRYVNRSGGRAPMVIRFFGPCSNPSVFIGGNEYAMNTDIAAGEYAVIDQRDKRVFRVAADGTKSNLFDARKKSVDNFLYAPTGSLQILPGGDFTCEVIFLTQRSEPKWI